MKIRYIDLSSHDLLIKQRKEHPRIEFNFEEPFRKSDTTVTIQSLYQINLVILEKDYEDFGRLAVRPSGSIRELLMKIHSEH